MALHVGRSMQVQHALAVRESTLHLWPAAASNHLTTPGAGPSCPLPAALLQVIRWLIMQFSSLSDKSVLGEVAEGILDPNAIATGVAVLLTL